MRSAQKKVKEACAGRDAAYAHLQTVIGAAPLVLWSVDSSGRLTRCEGQGLSALDVDPRDSIGQPVETFARHAHELKRDIQRALSGASFTSTLPFRGLYFHCAFTPIRNADGKLAGALCVSTDVTERVRAQESLLRNERALRDSQKVEAIGRLAGGVAHEFSNLLTVISGFTSLAQESVPPEGNAAKDLEEVMHAADRATGLTRQLLACSRGQVVEAHIVDLPDLLLQSRNMLDALLGDDIQIELRIQEDLGQILIDSGQFEQVLLNLALNSQDAMPDGGILTIAAGNTEASPGSSNAEVFLSVTDNGEGMTPSVLEHAFDPFFTTKERGKGSGLGLATCKGIIEQAGGEMSVRSESGRGTSVTIRLPRAEGDAPPLVTEHHHETTVSGSETILLAEDEDNLREFAARALRRKGFRVIEARDGEEALHEAMANTERIDILVTDVIMPRMNGRELAMRLADLRSGIRVLFLSGYNEDVLDLDFLPGTGVAFLAKPFTSSTLLTVVRDALDEVAPAKAG